MVRRPRLHHTESASWERGRSRSWPGHRLPGGSAAVRPVSHGTYRLWESAIVQVHAASCWHLSLAWGRPLRPVCRGCPAPQPGAAAVLATRLAFSDTPCDGRRTACGPSHLPCLTRQNVFRGSFLCQMVPPARMNPVLFLCLLSSWAPAGLFPHVRHCERGAGDRHRCPGLCVDVGSFLLGRSLGVECLSCRIHFCLTLKK